MNDVPTILEYASTAELWKELARRSEHAVFIRIPRHSTDDGLASSIQVAVAGDELIAYDLVKRTAENPLRLRGRSFRIR